MKSCPTCRRTFEDTFTFCLADGALLDPPFDPTARGPQVPPDSGNYETRLMRPAPPLAPPPQVPMVTNVAPALQPTIASTPPPPPYTAPPRARETHAEPSGKNLINGALVLGALVFLICALTAAAYTQSVLPVIGGVGVALALVLIRIFR